MRTGRFVVVGSRVLDYGEEVHRVGLRVGRFVETGPRTGRFVEASYILGPWLSNCLVIWMCLTYEALNETLMMNFVVAFLELWLGMVSLELWLGILGKHVAFLELWLRMTSLELWLGMAGGY